MARSTNQPINQSINQLVNQSIKVLFIEKKTNQKKWKVYWAITLQN